MLLINVIVFFLASARGEANPLSLAAVLIKNKDFSKAESVLSKYDLAGEKNPSARARYHRLRGLAVLQKRDFARALDHFRRSLSLKGEQPLLHLYIAQAWYGLENYGEAYKAIEKCGGSIDDMPRAWRLKGAILWKWGKRQRAWELVLKMAKKFPQNPQFQRQKISYLVELGLFVSALEEIDRYVRERQAGPGEYVFFAEHLIHARALSPATLLLEKAALLFPASDTVRATLGKLYLLRNMPYSAARLFQDLALRDGKYAAEASELLRNQGQRVQGRFFNGRIVGEEEKLKGRLAQALEAKNFELARALEGRIRGGKLYENEDIRYALAYVRFVLGDLDAAESHLTGVLRADLQKKSLALREEIVKCREKGGACF